MTTTNNTNPIKTITKIVTFYSDGTFSEFSPSPGVMPPVYPYPNPLTVPYQYHPPYPWFQNPVTYCGGYGGAPVSQKYSSVTSGGGETQNGAT